MCFKGTWDQRNNVCLKVGVLQGTIFDNWKPFKNDEKCFSFYFESSFYFWDNYILSWLFVYVEKRLNNKAMANFKF